MQRPTVSEQCFYAYHLQPCVIRHEDAVVGVDYLFHGGHLFQQYIVDVWASIEASKLHWVWNNQRQIHADLYNGVRDALNANDNVPDLGQQGQLIILPSSHLGSAWHMYQLLQDSLAICQYCHKPDIFLTMMANPKWPEIQEAFLELDADEDNPGQPQRRQTTADHPDIVACVFHLKLQALIRLIKDGFFGELAGDVYTIEFQKWGLPHVHLLIFLKDLYKI
ncbi:hypothetical protein WOLCODRAFT_85756, partial [Wolfiporia cocos MD-104 SS10]